MSERVNVIRGWKGIADYMGVSVSTVQRWAKLRVDPLPVFARGGSVFAAAAALSAWLERSPHVSATRRG